MLRFENGCSVMAVGHAPNSMRWLISSAAATLTLAAEEMLLLGSGSGVVAVGHTPKLNALAP